MITLQDAKDQLNITSDSEDGELQTFVDAVNGAAERLTGRVIDPREITERRTLAGESFLLRNVPVISLTSVVSLDGSTTWDVSNLDVDPATGEVSALMGQSVAGSVTITYQAGMSEIPAHFTLAGKFFLQHLWATQRGKLGAPMFGGQDSTVVPGVGYAVPNRVIELLGAPLPGIA